MHSSTSYLSLPLTLHLSFSFFFFFFNDTATTEIYTLSLHDALPIFWTACRRLRARRFRSPWAKASCGGDRKSTRLNSSHQIISYAVFCLKKKKKKKNQKQKSKKQQIKKNISVKNKSKIRPLTYI